MVVETRGVGDSGRLCFCFPLAVFTAGLAWCGGGCLIWRRWLALALITLNVSFYYCFVHNRSLN